jgi:hypothetical protein
VIERRKIAIQIIWYIVRTMIVIIATMICGKL